MTLSVLEQLRNKGFLRLTTETIELTNTLSANEYYIYLWILRRYKKEQKLASSFIATGLNISLSSAKRALKELESLGLIKKYHNTVIT